MYIPSWNTCNKIYRFGKIAYITYSGIPLWGWAAYEVYLLSKILYTPKKKENTIILTSDEVCGCINNCECIDKFLDISID